MRASRNIVAFFDGTGNKPRERTAPVENTNVRMLFLRCAGAPEDQQVSQYFKGVGTQRLTLGRLLAGAVGFGLTRKVKAGYRYLVHNYQPGDRIFLFGFSRGAFIARTLAGLVGHTGILRKEHEHFLNEALRLYIEDADPAHSRLAAYLQGLQKRSPGFEPSAPLPIHFIGVWDTVASVGWPEDVTPRLLGTILRHWSMAQRTTLPAHITHARHALALHELRHDFEPTLWTGCTPAQSLEQPWFAGCHSDVGGSYEQRALADVALSWMQQCAVQRGLQVPQPGTPVLHINNIGGVHIEDRLVFRLRGLGVREVLQHKSARLEQPPAADGSSVHPSALERLLSEPPPPYRTLNRKVSGISGWLEDVDDMTLPVFVRAYFAGQLGAVALTRGGLLRYPAWACLTHHQLRRSAAQIRQAAAAGRGELPEDTPWTLAILFACGEHQRLMQLLRALETRSTMLEGSFAAVIAADNIEAAQSCELHYNLLQGVPQQALELLPVARREEFATLCEAHFRPRASRSLEAELKLSKLKKKAPKIRLPGRRR